MKDRQKSIRTAEDVLLPFVTLSSKHSEKFLSNDTKWRAVLRILLLTGVTAACLVPFSEKAFHIDDPLFLWTAKQICKSPTDPYGFKVNWYRTEMPMSEITKNPPLAFYYIALVSLPFGWSEVALHLAFLIPALGVVLGTYYLALQLCPRPVEASLVTLLTPVFLISSTTIMCDVMMLAFWVWATALWIRGFESGRHWMLGLAVLLISLAALTKYFAITLLPLLFVYAIVRRRNVRWWGAYFAIPLAILAWYQVKTNALYGHGLLLDAAEYANVFRTYDDTKFMKGFIGLVFTGGCLAPALFYLPLTWSRRLLFVGSIALTLTIFFIPTLGTIGDLPVSDLNGGRWLSIVQVALFACIGMNVLVIAAADLWNRRDAASLLLFLWIIGTFAFASILNWSVNGRSILPMAPAAAILLMRRLNRKFEPAADGTLLRLFAPLVGSASIALLATFADYSLANAARTAANEIHQRLRSESGVIWFQGHWGFHYYLESLGGKSFQYGSSTLQPRDFLVVPENNTNTSEVDPAVFGLRRTIEIPVFRWLTTMRLSLGGGFYADSFGPLPFVIGAVPAERYEIWYKKTPGSE